MGHTLAFEEATPQQQTTIAPVDTLTVSLPVCAAHASTNQNVKALQLPGGWFGDDHHTNVVGQDVHAVVPGHCHRNLEFAGQELRATAQHSTAE